MTDPVIKGNRFALVYNESGGLKDIFQSMRQTYFERAGLLDATMDFEQRMTALESLSRASEIVNAVEQNFRTIIDTGKIEAANREGAERIASLPARKRIALTR